MRLPPTPIATLIALTLASLPSLLAAQRPYAWVMPQARPAASSNFPFAVLLDHRQELALGAAQVARIEGVRERLVQVNEPLVAQLRDAAIYEPERDEEVRAVEAARERFTENTLSAETEVRAILAQSQRDRARTLIGHDSWAYPPLEETGARQSAPPTVVIVENHNYYDANLYVVAGARRHRLGFVGGLKDEKFTIPDAFVNAASGLRFEVRQIPQSQLPLTDEVTVPTGSLVYLRIPPG